MVGPRFMGGLGYRALHEFNLAMLAKQGWRLMTNTNSLVYSVLKAKYFRDTDFMNARLSSCSNPSFTWRSVMKAQHLLFQGCRKRVGDGLCIDVWHDKWLPEAPHVVVPRVGTNPPALRVCDLFVPGRKEWNVQLLQSYFDMDDVSRILTIPLAQGPDPDRWIWAQTEDGCFTVSSCYKLAISNAIDIRPQLIGPHSSIWARIWNIEAPEKVKFFAWRACSDTIPVRSRLWERGMHVADVCPLCNRDSESLIHLLRDCPFAQEV